MSSFKFNSELLLGSSSDLDAVFLPINVDSGSGCSVADLGPPSWGAATSMGEHHQHHTSHSQHHNNHQHHHHRPQHDQGMGKGGDNSSDTKVLLDEGGDDEEEKETGPSILVKAMITDQPDSSDWCYRATISSMGVIVVVILFLVFGFDYVRQLLVWLETVERWQSLMVLMALFCLISFPMAWGLSLLMVVCGYLYGILYGPLVVALCMSVSLLISRCVMQSLCANYLRAKFYSPKVEAIVNVVSGKHGMKVIALTRLTPIPFGLQNALFSLSSMSMLRYLISSVGGFIPMILLHCYLGSTLRTMQDLMAYDSNHMVGYFIFVGQILLTIILLWFVVRKARVELKKAMDESDKSSSEIPNGDCSKTVFVNGDAGL